MGAGRAADPTGQTRRPPTDCEHPRGVERIRRDPFCGDIFVFRSRRLDRGKILAWDGSGLCLFYKRLETGRFTWPSVRDGVVTASPVKMAMLLEGLDWSRVRQRPVKTPKAAC